MIDYTDEILNMKKEDATTFLDARNVTWRIVEVDGQLKPQTFDLKTGRHNLHLENGYVAKVYVESL